MTSRNALFVSLTAVGFLSAPVCAELMVGPCARAMFNEYLEEVGGTIQDFQAVPTGTNLTTQLSGLSFASISDVFGTPSGPFHVEVSAANWGPNRIVGSPCDPGCTDDGRVRYEIVFDEPQRWAGVERVWGPGAKTEFYNGAGELLAEYTKTEWSFEYVGLVVETADTSGWVTRIEIDGLPFKGDPTNRMVGYTDDVIYGTGDVSGIEDPCPLDVDCSGELGFSDLLVILDAWGDCAGCRADLNDDDVVDFGDILVLLGNWGPCP